MSIELTVKVAELEQRVEELLQREGNAAHTEMGAILESIKLLGERVSRLEEPNAPKRGRPPKNG
jgi:polyhydroxyalkanoate synthesis regulator phasin